MQGKLVFKSKVIQTKGIKSSVGKRRPKPARSKTPQRWSRRIRSLPPIPINVLKPHRKLKKKCTANREMFTSTASLDKANTNFSHKVNREQKKNAFLDRAAPVHKSDSVEVFRIVPVVVYVKNSTKSKKFVPEEIRMHINDNPACQMVSQVINSHIHKTLKRNLDLGVRHSKRNRSMANDPRRRSMSQASRRKCPSRKKIRLYN